MRYDYYVFDFDGTIAETGEGIRKSVTYSLEKMGWEVPDVSVLNRFIGPPLHNAYVEFCGMTDEQAEQAISIYRERYVDIGLFESYLYPGMGGLLRTLRENGAYVAIASGKPEFMLHILAKHYGLEDCIHAIAGVTLDRKDAGKQDLILRALPEGVDPKRVCMVGDRCFDIEAAKALGMDAVGADYGYSLEGELKASGADVVFEDVSEMIAWLTEGMDTRGLFISLEGSDGCGKSTQIALLKEYLDKRGFETVLTREPGGCPISEKIREVILSLDNVGMSPECEALLYAASRVEHVRSVIEPALKSGKIVICDRFLDSSIAYQAYGRELGEAFIRQINEPAARRAFPDVTLLLQVDRAAARKRMENGAPLDRLEIEKEDFFRRVQEGFELTAQKEPARIVKVDAGRTIEAVSADVKAAVDAALSARLTRRG